MPLQNDAIRDLMKDIMKDPPVCDVCNKIVEDVWGECDFNTDEVSFKVKCHNAVEEYKFNDPNRAFVTRKLDAATR